MESEKVSAVAGGGVRGERGRGGGCYDAGGRERVVAIWVVERTREACSDWMKIRRRWWAS